MAVLVIPWFFTAIICGYAVYLARKQKYPENLPANEQIKVRRMTVIAGSILTALSIFMVITSFSSALGAIDQLNRGHALGIIGSSVFLIGSVAYLKGVLLWSGRTAMLLRRSGYLGIILFMIIVPSGLQILLPLIIIMSIPWATIEDTDELPIVK